MSRKPVQVYRGLIDTRLSEDTAPHIESVVNRYSDHVYAGQKLSAHLFRFVEFWARFVAFLNARNHT
ncbi:MAG: hypothetical protein ACFE7R_07650, partial [Candidatus Hodarchaeota archaeon]